MVAIRRSGMFLNVAICAALLPAGCQVNVVPPEEAALAGPWLLSAPETAEHDGKLFVFDDAGILIEIRKTSGNQTFIDRNAHRDTTVNGTYVRIETQDDSLFGGNELIFEGNFNDARNVINGKLQREDPGFLNDDLVITELGPATFTKQ